MPGQQVGYRDVVPHKLSSIQIADEQRAEWTIIYGFDGDLANRPPQRRIGSVACIEVHPALERNLGPRLAHPAVHDLLPIWSTPKPAATQAGVGSQTKLTPRMDERLVNGPIEALDQHRSSWSGRTLR